MAVGYGKPVPKKQPRPRQVSERTVINRVRTEVMLRDSYCRIGSATTYLGACDGEMEWAHLGDMRRFKTSGKLATERHTTAGTCCLCTKHHRMVDAHEVTVELLGPKGADSTIRFKFGGYSVLSVPWRVM